MALPRPVDSNRLIAAKLKQENGFQSHVLFELVRLSFVESFLNFLKQFNHSYSDIEINVDNISKGLTGFGEKKDYIEEIVTKNVSQTITIVLEQNFPSDQEVTNE